jgi:hypothetical protein
MASVTCRHCPAVLHRVVIAELDEWGWADENGHRFGDDPDLAHCLPDPYAYLAALGERSVTTVKAGRKRVPAPGSHAAGLEYSALKVRLDFGGTFHQHCPREWPAYGGPPAPVCCGWPGWLRPSGWECRQCGAAMAVKSAA